MNIEAHITQPQPNAKTVRILLIISILFGSEVNFRFRGLFDNDSSQPRSGLAAAR